MNQVATLGLNSTIPSQNGTNSEVLSQETLKYCLYARKSTESEERQILSIDSQIKEMLDLANKLLEIEQSNVEECKKYLH